MTGIVLKVDGVDYSANAIGFVPPIDATGLVYLNYFGGNATRTARNLASGGTAGVVVGDPTENTNDTTFTPGTNYVQTAVSETADKTIIAAVKPLTDANSAIVGNYKGNRVGDSGVLGFGNALYFLPTTGGDNLVSPNWQDAGWSEVSGSASNSISTSITNNCAVGTYYCLVGRTASNVRKIFNKTTGASAQSGNTTTVDLAVTNYQIGSMPTPTGFTAANTIAFVAIFQRALTDTEINTFYDYLKTYLSTKSITI